MKTTKLITACIAAMLLSGAGTAGAQDLKSFRLNNGMTVYIWEDPTMTDVYGEVAVRAGSFNDPAEYTGLAHYLEHVMFKGTAKIGALDWEKEKPVYEQIIAKYDMMAEAATPEDKAKISKEINALSIEESKLSVLNEYANLIEGIGGSMLNAGTSFDMTYYHNRFPANEINKWLAVASERFIDPVFRTFQSELETVYEEYNISQDSNQEKVSEFMLEKMFEGTPYARPIIGLGEHLKNPRLSALVKFYNDWYVGENMALILVGNIKGQSMIRAINATFGRIPKRAAPERTVYPNTAISGRKQYTCKMANSPSVLMAFNAPVYGSDDEIAFDLCIELLNNASSTGFLDRMSIAGDVMGASAGTIKLGNQGRALVSAVPYYDQAQRTYDSSKKVVKLMSSATDKIAKGEFTEEEINLLKMNMCRDHDLAMESDGSKAQLLRNVFIYNLDINKELAYKDRLMAVSIDEIKTVAARYFNDDVTVISNEIGNPPKPQKIEKPEYDPVSPSRGVHSAYAQWFNSMADPGIPESYVDWGKVKEQPLNSYSRIYYTKADKNDVFTLTLKYGANRDVLPYLKYGASLMNDAGVLAAYKSDKLKEEFARLGATCNIMTDDDYLYVTLRGYEQNLQPACMLLTKFLLMPELDEKQLGNVIGSAASSRFVRKKNVNMLASALREYLMYGDQSSYVKELTDQQLIEMDINKLTGSVIDATKYAAEIHYSGQLPFETVSPILSSSLPLFEGEKPSTSPKVRKMKQYTEDAVFFVPSSSFQQAQIFFYVPMGDYSADERVEMEAFNRYIGGSFNGLILQEIREYNSMAYSAGGQVGASRYPGCSKGFIGYVGTQNDKALDAVRLFRSLLTDMPEHPENLASIKSYLMQEALTDQPDDRNLSYRIAEWKLQGYGDDPAKADVPKIRELTFDRIVDYYTSNVKGRPIVIGIIGNPKNMSAKTLSEFGKVTTLSDKALFNQEDVLF